MTTTTAEKVPQDLPWARVYDMLGMKAEYDGWCFSNGTIINPVGYWTIPVIKGVTCKKVFQALRDAGVAVDRYIEDLDKDVIENKRDPNNNRGSYAISFKATVEADPENASQSANQRKKKGDDDITALERLAPGVSLLSGHRQPPGRGKRHPLFGLTAPRW
jgi:hypothetical protein